MPSLEIICVEQDVPLKLETKSLPFAVRSETELTSHRYPTPIWQAEFDQLAGRIYHLGSPDHKSKRNRGVYTAFDLLQNRGDHHLVFHRRFVPALKLFLRHLIDASPQWRIIFTTDYQFGGKARKYLRPLSLGQFWDKHGDEGLWFNAWYDLRDPKP